MKQYKCRRTGRVIDEYEYDELSYYDQKHYGQVNDSGDFLLSMAIGAVTDSALLGGMLGGDILGGIIGDALDGSIFD